MLQRTGLLVIRVPTRSEMTRTAVRPWPTHSSCYNPTIRVSTQRCYMNNSSSTAQKETQSKLNEYHGACHCGNIKVQFRTKKTPSELGSRACQCSFCRLHGASFTSDTAGSLSIKTSSAVNPYRMGTGTAEFLTCSNCGVVPAATWTRDDGKLLSVVRVQCLDIRDELEAHEKKWSVEHELDKPEERFDRRSRTWTPTEFGR